MVYYLYNLDKIIIIVLSEVRHMMKVTPTDGVYLRMKKQGSDAGTTVQRTFFGYFLILSTNEEIS